MASPRRDHDRNHLPSGLGIAMSSSLSPPPNQPNKLRRPKSAELLYRYANPLPLNPGGHSSGPNGLAGSTYRTHKYSPLGDHDDREQSRPVVSQHTPEDLAAYVPSSDGLYPTRLGAIAPDTRYPCEARPSSGTGVGGSASSERPRAPPGPIPGSMEIIPRTPGKPLSLYNSQSWGTRAKGAPNKDVVRQSHFSPPTPPACVSGDRKSAMMNLTQKESSPSPSRTRGLAEGNGRQHFKGVLVPSYTSSPTPYRSSIDADTGSTIFPTRPGGNRGRALSEGTAQLHRQGTLLTPMASNKRSSAELNIILGSSNLRASASRLLPQGELPIEEKLAKMDQVRIEAKKGSKARVEVDVVLERDVVVEGGEVRGRLDVRVRREKKGEGKVWIGGGKMRIVGFEDVPKAGGRHIFYHYPYLLPVFAPFWTPDVQSCSLFASEANEEGHRVAAEGTHSIPFSFRLPANGGAKGPWSGDGKAACVKYVVVGSIKLHIPDKKKRAIAHFYRPAVVYPYISPDLFRAPGTAQRPIEARVVKGLGWSLSGDKGMVELKARLSRSTWVAGQKVWIEVFVANACNRKIHNASVTLLRDVTQFHPLEGRRTICSWRSETTHDEGSSHRLPETEGFQPYSVRRKLCEEHMEASVGAGGGHVGSRGWWSGVDPGMHSTFELNMNIPPQCLTVPRSRLLSVTYLVRVKLNGSISVDLPINIINFISIDPPPSFGLSLASGHLSAISLQNVPQMSATERMPGPSSGPPGAIDLATLKSRFEQSTSNEATTNQHRLSFPPVPRPRPQSWQSVRTTNSNPETTIWFNGQAGPPVSADDPAREGQASLPRSHSSSALRPMPSFRSATMSYMSAVASEEEDLRVAEADRREGRQMSLAAINQAIMDERAAEEEVLLEAPFAPDTPSEAFDLEQTPRVGTSTGHLMDQDVLEAMDDLERISEEEREEMVDDGDGTVEHLTADERDSQSRQLEDELSHDYCYSRFGNEEAPHRRASRATPLLEPGQLAAEVPSASASIISHSVYDDDDDDGRLHQRGTALDHSPSVFLHGQTVTSPVDLNVEDAAMDAHHARIADIRSVLGSFDGRVSYQDAEGAKPDRPERPFKRAVPRHLQSAREEGVVRKGSLPTQPTSRHPHLPRTNSMDAATSVLTRRPSMPALSATPSRRPSTTPTFKAPTSPGVHSASSGRELRKKTSFTFATPTKPIKAREVGTDVNPASTRSMVTPTKSTFGTDSSSQSAQSGSRTSAHVKGKVPGVHSGRIPTRGSITSPTSTTSSLSRSPGLAPSAESESSHTQTTESRASTPDSLEAVVQRVNEIGEDIARQDTRSPIRARHGSMLVDPDRARTPDRTNSWTPPVDASRMGVSLTPRGDGSPIKRTPLSGPRLRVVSTTPTATSPTPSSSSRMSGQRASPGQRADRSLPDIPSSPTTSRNTPLQRRSYTAKLGPRPLPIPAMARSVSILSNESGVSRDRFTSTSSDRGDRGVQLASPTLGRNASVSSLASVSTTATSIEAALMRHKALLSDERSSFAYDPHRISEIVEDPESEGVV